MEALAAPLGVLIGLSLGAAGAGGSILAVPLLVYVVGLEAKEATSTSLAVVSAVSLAAMTLHWRQGRVMVRSGAVFGLSGVGASVGGSYLNRATDPRVLLLAFAGLMVAAAWGMIRSGRARSAESFQGASAGGRRLPGSAASWTAASWTAASWTKVALVAAGSLVGFVTGFFGVGGGFLVVPALALILRYPIHQAVGTSLLVISINAAVALASRAGGPMAPWHVMVAFTAGALVGVAIGTRIGATLQPQALSRAFGTLVLGIAVYTFVRTSLDF